MHITEKMPWNSDGARQAQVDSQLPVPSVMPAAIRAPTLVWLVFVFVVFVVLVVFVVFVVQCTPVSHSRFLLSVLTSKNH